MLTVEKLAVEEVGLNGIPVASKVGIVQTTINYKMFKFSKSNRQVDPKHLMDLLDATEKKNLLREYPILVDSGMNVLDGQHRLKVAESLKVPIYYMITDRVTVDDIAETNSRSPLVYPLVTP